MGKKKKGEAKSTEDDGTDIPSSNTRSGKSYGSAVDDVKHKLAAAKLDDAEHGMWLRKLSVSQIDEYLSKLDDAERAVQLGKLTPRLYHEYFQHKAEQIHEYFQRKAENAERRSRDFFVT